MRWTLLSQLGFLQNHNTSSSCSSSVFDLLPRISFSSLSILSSFTHPPGFQTCTALKSHLHLHIFILGTSYSLCENQWEPQFSITGIKPGTTHAEILMCKSSLQCFSFCFQWGFFFFFFLSGMKCQRPSSWIFIRICTFLNDFTLSL